MQCYFEFSDDLDNSVYIINVVLNVIFCVPTVAINLILLVAVWRTSVLRTPSNILICALASTDCCVGLLAQPIFAAVMLAMDTDSPRSAKCVLTSMNRLLANLFATMSFLTFTAISVDKLLMLHLHLRYDTLVTNIKIAFALAALFAISGVLTALNFVSMRGYIILGVVVSCTCFIIAFISYTTIYRALIHHQQQIHDQTWAVAVGGNNNDKILEWARFKKRTFSMICIYSVFVISYLPFLCSAILLEIMQDKILLLSVNNFSITLILFNSLLNPLLICWKMREIRNAMKQVVCCMCPKRD